MCEHYSISFQLLPDHMSWYLVYEKLFLKIHVFKLEKKPRKKQSNITSIFQRFITEIWGQLSYRINLNSSFCFYPKCFINPFGLKAPFLYPLKTSKNRKVFWYFQGVEKGCIGNEWVKLISYAFPVELIQTKTFQISFF